MSQKTLVAALFTTFLCSCAQQYTYVHEPPLPEDQSKRQLAADWTQCVALANTGSAGYTNDMSGQMMSLASFTNLRDTCLYGKGWNKVSKTPN